MQEDPTFNQSNGKLDWTQCTKVWNRKADGHNIFYKLSEHLQAYHKKWHRFINEKHTILHSLIKINTLTRKYRNAEHSAAAPPVPYADIPGLHIEIHHPK